MEAKKLSFTISWIQEEEVFLVQTLNGNEIESEDKFISHNEAMEYISDTMSDCLTCQETWHLTY